MDNDYELLYMAQEDIDTVVDILYNKYKNLLYSKTIKYSSSHIIHEDYLNEAKISLYKAIENYQDKYPFITYLDTCIERSLSNYRKSSNRNKHKILNEAISLDDIDNNISFTLGDNRYEPERILFEESNYLELKERILNKLTWKEELIFTLKEQNYTNKEISEITDNSLRNIYNIINRIKNKVSSIVSN